MKGKKKKKEPASVVDLSVSAGLSKRSPAGETCGPSEIMEAGQGQRSTSGWDGGVSYDDKKQADQIARPK